MVIKSTIPAGYNEKIKEKSETENIIISHEFYEKERPYTIIYVFPTSSSANNQKEPKYLPTCLLGRAIKEDIPVLFTNSTEAEAIKPFANTYLAIRVAFFNELDFYAEVRGLDAKQQ